MNVLALNLQALHARAAADIRSEQDRSLALIQQTVAQPWPRCCGERIDGATVWLSAGFSDPEVVAWLEAGVYTAAAAVRLALAGVTLGLAFTRGDVSVGQVLELRRPAREVRSDV